MRVAQSCLGWWGGMKVRGVMSPYLGGQEHGAASVDL